MQLAMAMAMAMEMLGWEQKPPQRPPSQDKAHSMFGEFAQISVTD